MEYRDFQSRLIPMVDKSLIIGVRTPILRKYAKEIVGSDEADSFFKELPHKFFDENNLHSILICLDKDYEKVIADINNFLPYVNNWATCDQMRPRVFDKNIDKLYVFILSWLHSQHTYTIRFGLEMLMKYFIDAEHTQEALKIATKIESDEYYVKMMIAWLFATALIKEYHIALPFIECNMLSQWIHNKVIQKAIESRCIPPETKLYLRSLKRH